MEGLRHSVHDIRFVHENVNSIHQIGLETVLRYHTISVEVSTKRNTGTQLAKAGNYVRSLGIFRARDMVAAGYSREYLRRLVGQEQVRQLGRGL